MERKNFYSAQGYQLSYQDNEKSAFPLILIHGWLFSGQIFDDLASALKDQPFRLLIPDLHGTGQSDTPDQGYTLEQYAQDVKDLLKHEQITSAVLIGNSMGGQIAQWVAADLSESIKGVMLINSVPAQGALVPDELYKTFEQAGQRDDYRSKIIDLATIKLTEDRKAGMEADAAQTYGEGIQQSFYAWSRADFSDKLAAIQCPVLVVGSDDPLVQLSQTEEQITQRIRRARLIYLPKAGHYSQVERPQDVANLTLAFLAGLSVEN